MDDGTVAVMWGKDDDSMFDDAGLAEPSSSMEEDPEVTEAFVQMDSAKKREKRGAYRFSPFQIGAAVVVLAVAPLVTLWLFSIMG